MANDLALLSYWKMRLVVFVCPGPECPGVFAAQACLHVEIMGLMPSLIHKVPTQMQVALLTSYLVQFHQCEFDLLMAGVATFLSLLRAKDGVDVIHVTTYSIQQNPLAGCLEMSHSCLNEMTSTIQLMHVAQIRPALLRLDNGEIRIEIAIGLLGIHDEADGLIEQGIKCRIRMGSETIAGGLYPLGNI